MRFIVVRDSRPVFQIEPLALSVRVSDVPPMSFEEFRARIDSVREPDDVAWTPEAVEEVIQEMYREDAAKEKKKKSPAGDGHGRKKAA